MTGERRRVVETIPPVVEAERATVVATLIRLTGDWDLAEDCVQDAAERALARWPCEGLPRTPGAWLTTVARRRALDVLRRRQTERAKVQQAAIIAAPVPDAPDPADRGGMPAAAAGAERRGPPGVRRRTRCHRG